MTALALPAVSRPAAVTAAAALTALTALLSFIPIGGPPIFVMIVLGVLAVPMLAGAWGLWNCRKWGAIVSFATGALQGLLAVPGIFFAPEAYLNVLASIGAVLAVVTCSLILAPSARRSYR
jgi:hypothetical protein